ncbi:hypothetical protein B0H14DRAFT_2591146 [Mycena olivaceomarginata]|nr:hypothetical protein B0H14DRAFT_2591146 [Mycena olivaceomarginata]
MSACASPRALCRATPCFALPLAAAAAGAASRHPAPVASARKSPSFPRPGGRACEPQRGVSAPCTGTGSARPPAATACAGICRLRTWRGDIEGETARVEGVCGEAVESTRRSTRAERAGGAVHKGCSRDDAQNILQKKNVCAEKEDPAATAEAEEDVLAVWKAHGRWRGCQGYVGVLYSITLKKKQPTTGNAGELETDQFSAWTRHARDELKRSEHY